MNDHYCKNSILLVNPASQTQREKRLREREIEKKDQLTLIDLERLIGQWNLNKQNQRLFNRSKWSFTQMHSIIEKNRNKKLYLLCFWYGFEFEFGCLFVSVSVFSFGKCLQSNQIETLLHVSFGVQYKQKCWSTSCAAKKKDSANNIINW